jgi:hypothetical protein
LALFFKVLVRKTFLKSLILLFSLIKSGNPSLTPNLLEIRLNRFIRFVDLEKGILAIRM